MEKIPIVIGLDPGTASGYAILDTRGTILKTYSSKDLPLHEIIEQILDYGKPIVVGTDKAKIPTMIRQFAARTGSRILKPDTDLKVDEKKMLAKGKEGDDHQCDALASALFAFNKIKDVLGKIDAFVENERKHYLKNKIIELVVTKEVSIYEAMQHLEPTAETKLIKPAHSAPAQNFERNYYYLQKKMQLHVKENRILRDQNKALKRLLAEKSDIRKEKPQKELFSSLRQALQLKELSYRFLMNSLKDKERIIKEKNNEIHQFSLFLSRWAEIIVIKKLRNLGSQEFSLRQPLLRIGKDDVILVDNPNEMSDQVIAYLTDTISMMLTKKEPNARIKSSFACVPYSEIPFKEVGHFAIALKKDYAALKKKKEHFSAIIEDYQRERKLLE